MLAAIEQAVQQWGFEMLSQESCQPPLEFSWRHLKGRLPVWRELRFLYAFPLQSAAES